LETREIELLGRENQESLQGGTPGCCRLNQRAETEGEDICLKNSPSEESREHPVEQRTRGQEKIRELATNQEHTSGEVVREEPADAHSWRTQIYHALNWRGSQKKGVSMVEGATIAGKRGQAAKSRKDKRKRKKSKFRGGSSGKGRRIYDETGGRQVNLE